MPTKADSSVIVQLERLEMVEQDIWIAGAESVLALVACLAATLVLCALGYAHL